MKKHDHPQSTYLFASLFACIMVTVVAVIVSIFLAGQRPMVVVVPGGWDAPGHGAVEVPRAEQEARAIAASATATKTSKQAASSPAAPQPQVVVMRVPAAPSLKDPDHAIWSRVPAVQLPVQPQQIAQPMLDHATIHHVQVQAVHDGRRMVWRLTWDQLAPARHTDVGVFSDAIAIQLPLVDDAPFTMGAPEMPVAVLYWKALWQEDVDEGFQDVHHRYPNMWVDLYWFARGGPPYPMASAFEDERSHAWLIAYRAGNPMADFKRQQSVEELIAEGFNTVTHVPGTPSHARGRWREGQWAVVIDRPLHTTDRLSQRLQAGEVNTIALAVWDGAAGNVGGRKHWCSWMPMRIEP